MYNFFHVSIIIYLISSIILATDGISTYHDPAEDEYFTDWLICGPFPNPLPPGINEYRHDETSLGFYKDYLRAYGGESDIRPYEGMKIKHPAGHELVWHRYHGYFARVPLDDILKPKDQVIAYAACVVKSSYMRELVLSISSNDGIRVWHNGKLILDHNTGGTPEPDRDLIAIDLKKGDNFFLLKISQGFGRWSFQFRFLNRNKISDELSNKAHFYCRPEITETQDTWHIYIGQKYKVGLLGKKIPVLLQIAAPNGKHIVASYNSFLGEEIPLKKSQLNLAAGLNPVFCHVNSANEQRYTMRSSIFVGNAPPISETYHLFKSLPPIDTLNFYGKQIQYNKECLDYHLTDDIDKGFIEPLNTIQQKKLVQCFAEWMTSLNDATSPYQLILPEIKSIVLDKERSPFQLKKVHTLCDFTKGKMNSDIERLQKKLLSKYGFELNQEMEKGSIEIGLSGAFPEDSQGFDFSSDEAYAIIVKPELIRIIGAGKRGLHYALVTLRHLFELSSTLPAAKIYDYPAGAQRSTFQNFSMPFDEKDEQRILEYIDLKYNEIVIWTRDFRNLDQPEIKAELRKCWNFIEKFHLEAVPNLWLNGDLSWYEGVFRKDEPIVFSEDEVKLGFQCLIDLASSRPILHSKESKEIYQRGKDFEIISIEPPIIRRLDNGAIKSGETVLMDADIYDRKTHYYSKPCPSEERAYQQFDDYVGKLISEFRPRKIHVNHDELGIINSDSRCIKKEFRDDELVAYQINRMREIIKKHAPDVDMIMWADAINPYHNGSKKGLEYIADLLHKDIIMANWFYSAENFAQRDLIELGTKYLLDKGFRIYGCPWDDLVNHKVWEDVLNIYKANPAFLGLMHTQWQGRNSGLAQTGMIGWSGKTWLNSE
jgi:hypothetical protein